MKQNKTELALPSDERTQQSVEAIKEDLLDHLFYTQGRLPELATRNDWYMALALTVRDRLLDRWIKTVRTLMRSDVRVVSYLSAEFLIGPQMGNNLINLDISDEVRTAIEDLGIDLDELLEQEEEPGLGNGGLGRLAACYLESLASLQIPAIGYGIRYEFGIFDQEIRDGWQVEVTDKWLSPGNPWEIRRPEISFDVCFGGHTETIHDSNGRLRVNWIPGRVVKGVAYDTAVVGYKVGTADLLRLWRAEATESFDFEAFNIGDYYRAVEEKVASETITKVLYPNDTINKGKQLRLEQQYFFVSCSLQDMLRINDLSENKADEFHDYFAVQLNDTHPSIAVAELMRLLVDLRGLDWEFAWSVTQRTFGYTNHTLLPEALETWPLPLFRDVLPRHLEIIFEINRRFLDEVRQRFPGDEQRVQRMSLIDENDQKYVRMAHLAAVGSHAINGVAALHTQLLKSSVLRDFNDLYPERFANVTNGVTPRRWMVLSNPRLTSLIKQHIGDDWIRNSEEQLKLLEPLEDDSDFREKWRQVKLDNKLTLAKLIKSRTGIVVDPNSIFDVQVKRIHEYKRQHLNALHILALYLRLKTQPGLPIPPRTFIFGGKAAPGYAIAKLIIKLINSIADVINSDKSIKDRLKVVFLPDFNVKLGQQVYPAADLSEQISTAGKEASGTGNMKFSLNGALTIGTLDGANVEIRELVGAENFFLFGLTANEVIELKSRGYVPRHYYEANSLLREVIDLIASGALSNGAQIFTPLVDSLLNRDEYLLLADFQAYVDEQDRVSQAFLDTDRWTRMSIINVARTGHFSSDRSIKEYCDKIWNVAPVKVEVN
jgi:glycogen phosphorylase